MEVIKSKEDFEKASLNSMRGYLVVHFFSASWSPECSQMEEVIKEISADYKKTKFFKIEAEDHEEISLQYGISSVPAFIFLLGKAGQDKMQGADPSKFLEKIQDLELRVDTACLGDESVSSKPVPGVREPLETRLKKLIEQSPVMIFMKGNPQQPRCGFSRQAMEILKKHKVEFAHFDILTDNDVREGLKKYSNWPSYPQLYINGELVGGVDVMNQMDEDGSLKTLFDEAANSAASKSDN